MLLGRLGLKQILDKEINRLKVLEEGNSSMNKDVQTRKPVQRSEKNTPREPVQRSEMNTTREPVQRSEMDAPREPIPKIAQVGSFAQGITELEEIEASQFEFNNDSILDQSIIIDSSLDNRTNFHINKQSNNDNCTNQLRVKDIGKKSATTSNETVSDRCDKLVEISVLDSSKRANYSNNDEDSGINVTELIDDICSSNVARSFVRDKVPNYTLVKKHFDSDTARLNESSNSLFDSSINQEQMSKDQSFQIEETKRPQEKSNENIVSTRCVEAKTNSSDSEKCNQSFLMSSKNRTVNKLNKFAFKSNSDDKREGTSMNRPCDQPPTSNADEFTSNPVCDSKNNSTSCDAVTLHLSPPSVDRSKSSSESQPKMQTQIGGLQKISRLLGRRGDSNFLASISSSGRDTKMVSTNQIHSQDLVSKKRSAEDLSSRNSSSKLFSIENCDIDEDDLELDGWTKLIKKSKDC